MTGFRSLSVGALFLLALAALSCGSNRQLQSVSIQPAQATANGSPVQFSATGTFSNPPSPQTLTSKDVTWCASLVKGSCPGNANPGAIMSQTGAAQCVQGFTGTTYVMAGTLGRASMIADGGAPFKVYGSATLTCP